MKEFKGTPGPWHYDDELGGVYSERCQFVCDVTDKDNAKLIAAAPELLGALQFTVHDVGHWLSTQKPELKEKIESAINKALENETNIDKKYQSALAALQKVEWDGVGLPPIGCACECQYKVHGSDWVHFECIAVDGKALFGWSNNKPVALQSNTHNFRPLRTEAERKRDNICDKIYGAMTTAERKDNRSDMAEAIYDAIAAGKIPGVKLED